MRERASEHLLSMLVIRINPVCLSVGNCFFFFSLYHQLLRSAWEWEEEEGEEVRTTLGCSLTSQVMSCQLYLLMSSALLPYTLFCSQDVLTAAAEPSAQECVVCLAEEEKHITSSWKTHTYYYASSLTHTHTQVHTTNECCWS